MGLFSFFGKKDNRQFVSAEEFNEKSAIQLNMLPVLMEKLRELNVDEEMELMLEFFFYTMPIKRHRHLRRNYLI